MATKTPAERINPFFQEQNNILGCSASFSFKDSFSTKEKKFCKNSRYLLQPSSRDCTSKSPKVLSSKFWNSPNFECVRQNTDLPEETKRFLSLSQENKTSRFRQLKHLRLIKTYELESSEIEKTFLRLVDQWRRETRGVSSTNELAMHPAYQQIIGMGKAAVPLLLRELERKSGQWFWALKAITREDPVPPESKGRTKEMIKFWLEWGRANGYKW